jgi:hypothetical protein
MNGLIDLLNPSSQMVCKSIDRFEANERNIFIIIGANPWQVSNMSAQTRLFFWLYYNYSTIHDIVRAGEVLLVLKRIFRPHI